MRLLFAVCLILFTFVFTFGQTEQSPLVEKQIDYKDWTYKDIKTDKEVNLRDFAKGKKLTMVVYFAPWCGNWKHDAPIIEKLYQKYKGNGLNVIAVGEYDPVISMRSVFERLSLTFPAVYESENRDKRQYTTHYAYRQSTGDTRNWGSPWYIFLTPQTMEKKGDTLTKKTFVINGEMIESEAEAFIRKNLKLPPMEQSIDKASTSKIEVCEDSKKSAELVLPSEKKP